MSKMQRFISAAKRLEKNTPHLNTRPIRVRGLVAGETCLEFLKRKIPSKALNYWEQALFNHQIACNGQIMSSDFLLRSSDQLTHTYLEDPEPPIPSKLEFVYEDEALLVINKPSGLPVHPCGRFNFHSFTQIAKEAWPELNLHLVHRLDRETSGLLILAKTKQAAQNLTQQFEQRTIQKTYLALVEPRPTWAEITCDMPISSTQKGDLGRRFCDLNGQPAITEFKHLSKGLVEAMPLSGRTNQIRVHLAYLGHPIVGDSIYRPVDLSLNPSPESGEGLENSSSLSLFPSPHCGEGLGERFRKRSSNPKLHLQAWKIRLRHPVSLVQIDFEIESTGFISLL